MRARRTLAACTFIILLGAAKWEAVPSRALDTPTYSAAVGGTLAGSVELLEPSAAVVVMSITSSSPAVASVLTSSVPFHSNSVGPLPVVVRAVAPGCAELTLMMLTDSFTQWRRSVNDLTKCAVIAGLAMFGYSEVATAQAGLLIEQGGRNGNHVVTRVVVGKGSSRGVRLSGKYMHLVSSATTTGGVSARSIQKVADNQVSMVLDASSTSIRGDLGLKLNIACPPSIPFITNDCKPSVVLPVKVLETGPLAWVAPSGNIPPNAAVTFNLTGSGVGFAKPLARLMNLKNVTVVQQTSSVFQLRGTTPSCGPVVVAVQDKAQLDDEIPFRKGAAIQVSLAGGTYCGGESGPKVYSTTTCPVGTVWNASLNQCA